MLHVCTTALTTVRFQDGEIMEMVGGDVDTVLPLHSLLCAL